MFPREILLAVLVVVGSVSPKSALAADGRRFFRAYMCDPARVTLAAIRHCGQANPERNAEFEQVAAQWELKNRDAILVLKEQCTAEVRERTRTEAAADALKAKIKRLNAQTIAAKTAEISKDPQACESLVKDIASGEADVGKFVREKE